MKLITANKLNRLWRNGIVPALNKKIEKTKVLTTMEQVAANTNAENIAGATAVKVLNDNLNRKLTTPNGLAYYADYKDGKYGVNTDPNRGADTFIPFSRHALERIFFVGDDISVIDITQTVRATAQISSGLLHLKSTGADNATRGVYISVDVTRLSYISIVGTGALATDTPTYWFIDMDGAVRVTKNLLDVSRLTGKQSLRIYPASSQGVGASAYISQIFGF